MRTCVHYKISILDMHKLKSIFDSKAKPVYLTDAPPISSSLVGTPCVYHDCAFNNMILQHMQIYVNAIAYLA